MSKSREFDDLSQHFFDVGALLSFLLRNKFRVLFSGLVFAAIAAFLSLQLTPYYNSNAQVLLNVREDPLAGVDQGPVNYITVQNEIAVLLSDDLLARVLDNVTLYAAPFDKNASPGLVETLIATVTGEPLQEPEQPNLRKRINALRDTIEVKQIGESFAIRVGVRTGSPKQSTEIANEIVNVYLQQQVEESERVIRRSEGFHLQRVEQSRADYFDALDAVERHRATMGAVNAEASDLISVNYEATKHELERLRVRESELSDKLDLLERFVATLDFDMPELLEITEISTSLRDRQNRIDTGSGASSALDDKVVRDAEQALAVIRTDLRRIENRIDVGAAQVELVERRSRLREQALSELARLERKAVASESLYNSYLQSLSSAQSQYGIIQPASRIISEALPNTVPVSPNKTILTALGGVLGVLIGLIYAVFTETFRNTWRKLGDFERDSGIKELSFFPRIRRREVASIFRGKASLKITPMTAAAQNLQIALSTRFATGCRTLLMTSTTANEGKTTTSLLLAIAIQRAGKRALVVECDFHRPTMAKLFKIKPRYDLVDVLNSVCASTEAVVAAGPYSVPVILARADPDSIGLLSSDKLKLSLEALESDYDVIILDGPPMIATADAISLATITDGVIFCYLWNMTPQDDALDAIEKLRWSSDRIAGAVVTMVNTSAEARYHRFGRGRRTREYGAYEKYASGR